MINEERAEKSLKDPIEGREDPPLLTLSSAGKGLLLYRLSVGDRKLGRRTSLGAPPPVGAKEDVNVKRFVNSIILQAPEIKPK